MEIKRNILLNPGPATTTDSVKLAQVVPDICPREREFSSLMSGIRESLVKIVHGDILQHTAVLFCGSGTICMDVCLNSLLPENKRALIINNGAYSRRAVEICQYYGLPHIDLKFSYTEPPELSRIEKELQENQDIALVYVTHHETGTGLLNPIREIGALAHRYGAVFVTDTTSSYAMIPIDMEADNIDFCMASSQKGIMAMTGLSFVVGKRSVIERSAAFPKRSYYCNLYMQYEYFEKTGEMHFTPPVQTIYSVVQALKEYFEEGEQEKWARHRRVYEALHEGIDRLGFQCLLKREYESGLVVTVLYPKDVHWDFDKVHDYCYRKGFTIYPGKVSGEGTFRLCALGAIDRRDIEDFFAVFEEAVKDAGVKIPIDINAD